VRVAAGGKGKRGGARVVYYFHHMNAPIFLFAIFAKNEKSDLNPSEKTQLKAIIQAIKTELKKSETRVKP